MLLLIAHRGLTQGPDIEKENHPQQITKTLEQNYDCEIDLRVINGELWLGHDQPQYRIDHDFLSRPGLWIHCKNLQALEYCQQFKQLNYFWHDTDDYTLTSQGFIWTYPEKPLSDKSIRLMPEWHDPELKTIVLDRCYAICTDWVSKAQGILNNC